MLQLNQVSFTYPGQESPVLKDLTLAIRKGTFLAIMGANGSGKSTLCKLFNGIVPHFFVGDLSGQVLVDGEDTLVKDVASLSEKVGYVYQDFENSIVRSTVWEEVTFAPLNYGLADYKERALHALEILKISHLKNEYIWQLSGGQKHLVALAAVVAVDPEYIIVDEPVAQLDPYHARQTYEMLKLLHEHYHKTIIVIEHHTEMIAAYCQEVLLMKAGRVRWIKPVQEALTDLPELVQCHILPPQVTQLAYELHSKAAPSLPITLEQGARFLEAYRPVRRAGRSKMTEQPSPYPTLRIQDVTATYKDYRKTQRVILKNINLTFYQNERIAIVGNNGAGKSTLMRLISRLMKPASGQIEIVGEGAGKGPEETANLVAYLYQNPEEMFIDDSIEKDVAYFLKARQIHQYEEKVEMILETLDLKDIRKRDARLLSGGQQRRVSLAIGMGMTPRIVLLDEPTGSLDIGSRKELIKLLGLLKEHIQTAVVATHDMQLVADWATRVIVLHQGEVIADTTPRELFESAEILEKANLIPPQVIDLSHCLKLSPPCLSVTELKERLGQAPAPITTLYAQSPLQPTTQHGRDKAALFKSGGMR